MQKNSAEPRKLISPHSFPLSLARRVWTWPLVAIGHVLGRLHRGLAKLLRVNLYAAREHREYVSVEYARAHAEEVSWDEDEDEEDEGRPFILVPTPFNRRERLIAPLGRASRRLSQRRLRWQQARKRSSLPCSCATLRSRKSLSSSMERRCLLNCLPRLRSTLS